MMKICSFLILLIYLTFLINKFIFFYLCVFMFLMFFYLLMFNFNNYWMLLYSGLGLDKFSLSLIMLLIWIFIIMVMISNNEVSMSYFQILMFLVFILFFCFSFMNFFMFYFFFEISLIPVFLIIMGWGYQPERLKASLYMFIYTLFFSLPFMVILFIIYNLNKNLNFIYLEKMTMESLNFLSGLVYFFMFMAFFVKLPIFLFHNWLPKAHVEAPVVGSMILAAVMLKLGGYGLLRLLNFLDFNFFIFNDLMISLSLLGVLILSILCIRLYDMKVIVAYSSVVHMGMMLVGLMLMKQVGLFGGFMMMLGHGLCSSGMFLMVNYFYVRFKSRNLFMNKGSGYLNSSIMFLWFLLCVDNMGAPISLNLLSEITIILMIFSWSKLFMLILILGMFFSAAYNLYLFSFSFHGKVNNLNLKIYGNNVLEYFSLLLHLIPLNLLVLKVGLLY
uniref:NADH-ubiquinone oxidoreductase chain 4 n=1 Tax=Encyrtus eulecaniumiae TaxID=1914888 RepID=A0A7S5FRE6_9HYME|nr:NADH dehydrogenase subunit 4 [Encyrtus eulecaniumiae]QGA74470.1 NADH dehydrogenase subunit 4 [Encyrtus eulecaniumiae]QGA74483.1 NADH dehydrogenase subunit 4 [Encyrtus eulecaniumiae]QGA74496.1 NADH dehydrogenase subunit 4 [Encyrtus eulecaniumiae]